MLSATQMGDAPLSEYVHQISHVLLKQSHHRVLTIASLIHKQER